MKKQRGITLVALVITIIILLILAGISIQALTNQGIFAQAEEAKKRTENAQKEEDEILKNYLEQMNAITGGQVTESVLDGTVVTPINDITIWLKTAGISKQYPYTTTEQVIEDSTCVKSLMNNENAMKYLARSTEFADTICTSETAMTYLGQSAYVDDTVLNSDIWVSKIKSSLYWDKIYTQQFTIYGGAYETITITGYGGSFTTNADGYVTHALPIGTITLNGSVSGQSFTRTVTSSTTEVYVMPTGKVLYWYGNKCVDITETAYTHLDRTASVTALTNSYEFAGMADSYSCGSASVMTTEKIDISGYSTFRAITDDLSTQWFKRGMIIATSINSDPYYQKVLTGYTYLSNDDVDISGVADGSYHIGIMTNGGNGHAYAFWLE